MAAGGYGRQREATGPLMWSLVNLSALATGGCGRLREATGGYGTLRQAKGRHGRLREATARYRRLRKATGGCWATDLAAGKPVLARRLEDCLQSISFRGVRTWNKGPRRGQLLENKMRRI